MTVVDLVANEPRLRRDVVRIIRRNVDRPQDIADAARLETTSLTPPA